LVALALAAILLAGCAAPSPPGAETPWPETMTTAPAATSASAAPSPTTPVTESAAATASSAPSPNTPVTSPATDSAVTNLNWGAENANTPASDSAATNLGWGTPIAGDEFNYTGAPDAAKWKVYNSVGHAGNGIRSPYQATVDGSKLVITGTADGTTAGMSAKFGRQQYGRWEVRTAGSGDNEYHLVSILWPDSGNWPCDGEINYAETTGDWNLIKFFHHYSCDNRQVSAAKTLDVSQFHNYAVDWSPKGTVGYVDGVKWFETTDPAHQPPGPMHQTLQLDWFPDSTPDGPGEMRVDWVRVYAAAGG
jgi:hypothetical protein